MKVEGAEDHKLFMDPLRVHPEIGQALAGAVRSSPERKQAAEAVIESLKAILGTAHQQTVEAAIESAKAAVATAPRAPRPTGLKTAVETFVDSRVTLSDDRRSTAGEKKRALGLLLDHLAGKGADVDRLQVHGLARPDIVDFVTAYASRGSSRARNVSGRTNQSWASGRRPYAWSRAASTSLPRSPSPRSRSPRWRHAA